MVSFSIGMFFSNTCHKYRSGLLLLSVFLVTGNLHSVFVYGGQLFNAYSCGEAQLGEGGGGQLF